MISHVNRITERIIGAAIEVHRALGPGLLESTYKACLVYEVRGRGSRVEAEVALPVVYKQVRLDCGYRIDLLVDRLVVVELKAVVRPTPVFAAQVLTYLRLSGYPAGLLINFDVPILKDGITRIVNSPSIRRPSEEPRV